MEHAQLTEARPYHHGDLRRALIEAGRRLLEVEGGAGISLRAVAREAGVSPAAPYHHFRDKSELLDALAFEGWDQLGNQMREALSNTGSERDHLVTLGVAYVRFARMNPAIYRVMIDCSRSHETMPEKLRDEGAYQLTRDTLVEAGVDPKDETGLELAAVAVWCAAHGVAEMVGFKEFEPLRVQLGGEEAFLRSIFSQLDIFRPGRKVAAA
ncbi:TetR/AcrR family transcriptional regulator [Phenylobacterium sp.]|jgi:AcrR family transcriptional regulator|uniref:TetR/AcrR family transcriptional regulator n=1 Tax=Phenylobacterium sp. TaxID=1871053 RepID=UPI0025E57078|nr:TetR/AcrR family transcriptional regulator [Phenylobacterium sp.]MCA6223459.1 TetR/AcrR family transcriptional regulator [Phenylobacterium sp.]MCA6290693.1 TetR/AcrR family transcriptional regulator [Phenylobacterium sp.]